MPRCFERPASGAGELVVLYCTLAAGAMLLAASCSAALQHQEKAAPIPVSGACAGLVSSMHAIVDMREDRPARELLLSADAAARQPVGGNSRFDGARCCTSSSCQSCSHPLSLQQVEEDNCAVQCACPATNTMSLAAAGAGCGAASATATSFGLVWTNPAVSLPNQHSCLDSASCMLNSSRLWMAHSRCWLAQFRCCCRDLPTRK